jgi:hypothetical protein
LASAAEYLYGGQQKDRIGWFNDDKQETIQKGNNFFIWNGFWENDLYNPDLLSNYATVYLFFQWLRIHADNDNDSGIYGDIINSEYTDYRAVTSAARQKISSAFSGIGDNEAGWAELLGAWNAANRLRAGSASIYGYNEEIDLDFNWSYSADNNEVSLYPGEGVYSRILGTIDPSEGAPAIRYLGLNSSGDPVKSPPYSTTYLLTYNGSTSNGGSAETGYAADLIPVPAASMVRAMAAGSGEETESPEAILRRWDGGRVFLEKLQESGTFPRN